MRKSFTVVCVCLLASSQAFAEQVRIYCEPDGVIFEKKTPEIPFSEDNKISHLKHMETIVIEESEIPRYKYRKQLVCKSGKLVVDESIKTPRILRHEQIKQTQAALDAELGKAEPDVVAVLRLQRAIEILKEGK